MPLNLGLTSIPIVVTTASDDVRTYTLNVTRVSAAVQQAYAKASNPTAVDLFGRSVAICGDTLVVGADAENSAGTGVNGQRDDESASDSGAAYVFVRAGNAWVQQAYLKASNTGAGDHFGWSVAIWGDTVAVGAYVEGSSATGVNGNQADNSAGSSGAVYVFTRSASAWSQQAYLKASNTATADQFGISLALWDDTLVVGATQEDSAATGVGGNGADNTVSNSGAAYVFTRSGSTWSQQAYLKASNTGLADRFGNAVAIWGDTIAVGALFERSGAAGINGDQSDDSAGGAGAIYVFTRSDTSWSQQAYVKASNPDLSDNFGTSVALWGNTLAVGAPSERSAATGINGDQTDDSVIGAGAAYVFTRVGSTWGQQVYLKASNTGTGDSFGVTIALWGDALAVGADRERSAAVGIDGNQTDNTADDAGAVYVFTRITGWSQRSYVKASNTDGADRFGSAVSLWGDTLAVGAYAESSAAAGIDGDQSDNSAQATGAVYVLR